MDNRPLAQAVAREHKRSTASISGRPLLISAIARWQKRSPAILPACLKRGRPLITPTIAQRFARYLTNGRPLFRYAAANCSHQRSPAIDINGRPLAYQVASDRSGRPLLALSVGRNHKQPSDLSISGRPLFVRWGHCCRQKRSRASISGHPLA